MKLDMLEPELEPNLDLHMDNLRPPFLPSTAFID